MVNRITIIFVSVFFLVIAAACTEEKKEDKSQVGQQTQAVTKKIEKKIETSQQDKKAPEVQDKSEPDKKAQIKEVPEKQKQPADKVEKKEQSEVLHAQQGNTEEYDPTGKINPFLPFVTDDSEKSIEKTDETKKKREPLTPLERIDIGQLRLTAITRMPNGNIALVEEASGKGYVLNEGTYIGLNSGKVISILTDKVIIEEEIENIFGKVSIQERELKLQKPTGE